jgi:hypothetical protein
MTIQLVYIATSVYCNFADKLFASLDNLFPGSQKIIDILTDNLEYFEKFRNESFLKFNVHKIYQLPYPIVNYMKFSYIKGVLDYDADATIFVDADGSFIERPADFWTNISNHFKTGKVLISYHIMYAKAIHDEIYIPGQNPYYDIKCVQTLQETDNTKASYIPYSEFLWIGACFCAAAPKEFNKLCTKIEYLIGKDLKDYHYIPKVNEESYLNKALYEYYAGIDTSIQFVPNIFVAESGIVDFLSSPPGLCFVKIDADEVVKRKIKENEYLYEEVIS